MKTNRIYLLLIILALSISCRHRSATNSQIQSFDTKYVFDESVRAFTLEQESLINLELKSQFDAAMRDKAAGKDIYEDMITYYEKLPVLEGDAARIYEIFLFATPDSVGTTGATNVEVDNIRYTEIILQTGPTQLDFSSLTKGIEFEALYERLKLEKSWYEKMSEARHKDLKKVNGDKAMIQNLYSKFVRTQEAFFRRQMLLMGPEKRESYLKRN